MDYRNQRRGKINRNNGAAFESIIDATCRHYEFKGAALIEKTPEPMKVLGAADQNGHFKACFTHRAQPDYKGTIKGGIPVVFEAKHTETDKIDRKRVTDEQLDRLVKHQDLGAVAFVLCSFGYQDYFSVPVVVWQNMKEAYGRQYVKKEDLEAFRCPYINGYVDFLGILGGKEDE